MLKKTKQQMVLEYLQAGHGLTGIEALEKMHVYRLSSVIKRLRNKGYNIVTIRVKGESATYGEYHLIEAS